MTRLLGLLLTALMIESVSHVPPKPADALASCQSKKGSKSTPNPCVCPYPSNSCGSSAYLEVTQVYTCATPCQARIYAAWHCECEPQYVNSDGGCQNYYKNKRTRVYTEANCGPLFGPPKHVQADTQPPASGTGYQGSYTAINPCSSTCRDFNVFMALLDPCGSCSGSGMVLKRQQILCGPCP